MKLTDLSPDKQRELDSLKGQLDKLTNTLKNTDKEEIRAQLIKSIKLTQSMIDDLKSK